MVISFVSKSRIYAHDGYVFKGTNGTKREIEFNQDRYKLIQLIFKIEKKKKKLNFLGGGNDKKHFSAN